jgi:hypothetical protein
MIWEFAVDGGVELDGVGVDMGGSEKCGDAAASDE